MNLEELGRRAVACPRWRWMPGCAWMWAQSHGRMNKGRVPDFAPSIPGDAVPDLSDPATLGCLLYLVREATGERTSAQWFPETKHDYAHWAWYSDHAYHYGKLCEGSTEAECLVKVLEAAL